MLESSDIPILPIVEELASIGLEGGYCVPTRTGLEKGYMDAHAALRQFLKSKGIHNFDKQFQGEDHKVTIEVNLVTRDDVEPRKMTLYRPNSKQGDPRIGISRLSNYAAPLNLLVFIAVEQKLYVFNASDPEISAARHDVARPLGWLLKTASGHLDVVAAELTGKLIDIYRLGYVPSLRTGDTGVGYTLETMLGIKANSSRTPDYKGIEIKSARIGESMATRHRANLFSKTPNWKLSAVKSGTDLLLKIGYVDPDSGRLQFYHELKAKPNSKGLFIANDEKLGRLNGQRTLGSEIEHLVCWEYSTLMDALAKKHRRTFWVKARTNVVDSTEHFHYVAAEKTDAPLVSNLPALVESSAISLDFTLYQNPSGRAGDHGYLFKLNPRLLGLLFPPPQTLNFEEFAA
jgi:hypothetical protein